MKNKVPKKKNNQKPEQSEAETLQARLLEVRRKVFGSQLPKKQIKKK